MRIKNKEIRARRHRKDQKVKDAAREIRAKFGEPHPTPAEKSPAPKKVAVKAAPKKAADATAKPAAAKKATTPKAKKSEPAAE